MVAGEPALLLQILSEFFFELVSWRGLACRLLLGNDTVVYEQGEEPLEGAGVFTSR